LPSAFLALFALQHFSFAAFFLRGCGMVIRAMLLVSPFGEEVWGLAIGIPTDTQVVGESSAKFGETAP
jgi:hypothetical protein